MSRPRFLVGRLHRHRSRCRHRHRQISELKYVSSVAAPGDCTPTRNFLWMALADCGVPLSWTGHLRNQGCASLAPEYRLLYAGNGEFVVL